METDLLEIATINRLAADAHVKKEYRPVAVAIIKDASGRTLFVQSAKNEKEWYLPQGGIEAGENALGALLREIGEELKIAPEMLKNPRFEGYGDLDAETARADKRGFTKGKRYFFFSVDYDGPQQLDIDRTEISYYKWAGRKEFQEVLATTRNEKRSLILNFLADS